MEQAKQQKEFYTVGELARYLSTHPNTIYSYVKAGKLKAVRIGLGELRNSLRIPKSEVERITKINGHDTKENNS